MATVPVTRALPSALKANGLRNLPAIIHGDAAIDTVEEIIDYIELRFPDTNTMKNGLSEVTADLDKLTRNFFSRFCFYIKSVSKDSSALLSELRRLDDLLQRTTTR